ncbi:LysR family transcriptional regulator [Pseudomonas aegrilactucae]|uniref:LysR family transcriptional regulator n=1 Tax=Pseudomonas aegrilactucae TaxID=2854028 RepID=A0A9Q3AEV8_9PSED|nr:LysR family transcriptional regulator [Pseudomonas aegrilactucae]MBV6288919.1 LysR family transcriptional regulator [Pseudomonas aegrilactucae]
MNLKALRCCVEIIRQGSFTKAAQSLHIAQPALSMAVTRLEEELGVMLFNRIGRRVTTTAEGERYLARVESALRELDTARQELRDMVDLQSGEVRLGIPPMFGLYYLPTLLSAFRQAYPGVIMSVAEGSADDISQRLERREIDLALLESRRVTSTWDSVLLGEDEMVLCMHPDHPLATRPHLEAADLHEVDMAVFDQTFLQRHLLDDFVAARGIAYRTALQSNFVSLVIQAARDKVGIATLLRSVQQCTPGLVAVPFQPAQPMSFRLCWRQAEYLPLATRRFIDFVQARGALGMDTSLA